MTDEPGCLSNPILTERVSHSSPMYNFLQTFGNKLEQQLRQKGDISLVSIDLDDIRPKSNTLYHKFHGLQILINDTEFTQVKLNDFQLSNDGQWSAIVTVEMYDHFGLDKNDALKYQFYHGGFAAWWALQHTKGFAPFTTKVVFQKKISGQL